MNIFTQILIFIFLVSTLDIATASSTEENYFKVAQVFAKKHENNKTYYHEIAAEVSKVKSGKTKIVTDAELDQAITSLLNIAPNTAHIVTDDDQVYWLLKSIYSQNVEDSYIKHIGVWFERRGTKWHVGEVFEGSPAFKAGVQRGDEVVSVDGKPFEPVLSFSTIKTAEKARMLLKRTPWDEPFNIAVNTVYDSLEQSMYSATKLSVVTKIMNKKNIGYFRLWGGSRNDQNSILKYVIDKFQNNTDSMILDLRGGIGVLPSGLESFFLKSKGQLHTYTKPLIVLVNRFTADDKKQLAAALQANKRALIIGESPMQAPLKGVTIDLEPRKKLIFVPDDQNNSPLLPDKKVKDTLVYTGGQDSLLLEALKTATE